MILSRSRMSALAVITLTLFSLACSKKFESAEPVVHADRQAPVLMGDSFGVASADAGTPGLSGQANQIVLNKKSLGKAFLLSPTIILKSNSPIIDHLAPKIVAFEKSGSRLALFELNKDAVYKNLNSDKLLETFDVVSEDDQSLTFAWNYGLSAVPMTSFLSGGASDFPAESADSTLSPVLPSEKSFVRRATLEKDQLEIEQVSEVVVLSLPLDLNSLLMAVLTGSGLTQQPKSMTVKMNVNLRPYIPNPNFKKRPTAFHQGIGAFETAIVREGDGKMDFYSSLWDLSEGQKPLIYAITKGTPAEHLPAIREGILYWNKVAGREIIQVQTDADPEATPTERTVLVHWIPFDRAGFARASFQTDPLTGEILRADVYLTSAFARGASIGFRQALENLRPELGQNNVVVPGFFRQASLCHFEKSVLAEAQFYQAAGKDSPQVSTYIADQIREVTAHEVGHTLGMRHNFAGSLHTATATAVEQTQQEVSYIKGELPDGAMVSSSVMDYVFGVSGGLIGAHIQKNALPYDQAYVNWAYNGLEKIEKVPPFCSDGLADTIIGCRRGDVGTNSISSVAKKLKDSLRTLQNFALQNIVMLFHPKNPLDRMSEWQIMAALANADLQQLGDAKVVELTNLQNLLSENAQDFAVELAVGKRGWFNDKKYDAAIADKIATELETVGGLEGMIAGLYPMNENFVPRRGWLKANLLEIYQRPEFKSGETFEGVPYSLSVGEDAFIGQLIESFSNKAEEAWLFAIMKAVTFKAPTNDSDDSSDVISGISGLFGESDKILSLKAQQEKWWPKLALLAENILVVREGTEAAMIGEVEVQLPKASFGVPLRLHVIKNAVPANYRLYGMEAKNLASVKSQILKVLSEVLGKELESSTKVTEHIKTLSMDLRARTWFSDELKILKEVEGKL